MKLEEVLKQLKKLQKAKVIQAKRGCVEKFF
jgi:hypothetical protein